MNYTKKFRSSIVPILKLSAIAVFVAPRRLTARATYLDVNESSGSCHYF
ncbi:hypothetical protein GNF10_04680 [Nostoc sp. UCD121]|nr:hypothetical protein [Nostoc sp. UCD121]MBC1275296.1 hypothetical protein [Nostoc sp. UCD121]